VISRGVVKKRGSDFGMNFYRSVVGLGDGHELKSLGLKSHSGGGGRGVRGTSKEKRRWK